MFNPSFEIGLEPVLMVTVAKPKSHFVFVHHSNDWSPIKPDQDIVSEQLVDILIQKEDYWVLGKVMSVQTGVYKQIVRSITEKRFNLFFFSNSRLDKQVTGRKLHPVEQEWTVSAKKPGKEMARTPSKNSKQVVFAPHVNFGNPILNGARQIFFLNNTWYLNGKGDAKGGDFPSHQSLLEIFARAQAHIDQCIKKDYPALLPSAEIIEESKKILMKNHVAAEAFEHRFAMEVEGSLNTDPNRWGATCSLTLEDKQTLSACLGTEEVALTGSKVCFSIQQAPKYIFELTHKDFNVTIGLDLHWFLPDGAQNPPEKVSVACNLNNALAEIRQECRSREVPAVIDMTQEDGCTESPAIIDLTQEQMSLRRVVQHQATGVQNHRFYALLSLRPPPGGILKPKMAVVQTEVAEDNSDQLVEGPGVPQELKPDLRPEQKSVRRGGFKVRPGPLKKSKPDERGRDDFKALHTKALIGVSCGRTKFRDDEDVSRSLLPAQSNLSFQRENESDSQNLVLEEPFQYSYLLNNRDQNALEVEVQMQPEKDEDFKIQLHEEHSNYDSKFDIYQHSENEDLPMDNRYLELELLQAPKDDSNESVNKYQCGRKRIKPN